MIKYWKKFWTVTKVVAVSKPHQMDTEEEMCGICGFTGYRQDQKTVIERMMKAIAHRGPDSKVFLQGRRLRWAFEDLVLLI
ncbi:MAG: hypothetical protein V8Q83_00415 [Blautia sp.]